MEPTTLRCFRCKHTWKVTSRVPKLCPFCGKEESIEYVSAEGSFSDIDDMLK